MANRDIFAIGTSAGGVEALLTLAKHLPVDFPAAVFVTIHLAAQFRSSLDELLSRAGRLPAIFARDGDTVENGRIYLAPRDRHLLIEGDKMVLGHGLREN